MTRTVSVTGGSGGIGQSLLEQLTRNYKVRVLFRKRTPLTDHWLERGCEAVWGDLSDKDAVAKLVHGSDTVFHCAALVGKAPYPVAHAVNVEGTRTVAEAAAAAGVRRFVHMSSIAVYTSVPSRPEFTEDVPVIADDTVAVYARTKIESEQAVRAVARATGLKFTILRPSCVYGPRTVPFTQVPLGLIRAGFPVILGDGSGLIDAVYVDDVTRAMVQAAETDAAEDQVFNIAHQSLTIKDFYAAYGEIVGRPPRHLPMAVLRGLSRALNVLPKSFAGKTDDSKKALRYLTAVATNTSAFPHTRATETFGYAPSVSVAAGMLRIALWARSAGLVDTHGYAFPTCGPLTFQPAAVAHPAQEADIAQCITAARENGLTARAIGSLHSQCAIADTDGICIVLDGYRKLVSIDGNLVTVQSGMTLSELNEELAHHGLALPVLGSITAQTISGAISTATHGGSIQHGALSDYVERIRVVRAGGSVVDLSRSSPEFGAAVVSLGLLGIISTVTLRCVPAFTLRSRSYVANAADIFQRFDEYQRSAEFVDMLYFPAADKVEVLAIERTSDAPSTRCTQPPRPTSPPGPVQRAVHSVALKALKGLAAVLLKAPALQSRFARALVGTVYRTSTGRSDTVLAFNGTGPAVRSPGIINDMEIAVPYADASAALTSLRDHFRRTGRYPLFPVHIRASAASDQWLSPAHNRQVCWIELCSYPRNSPLFEDVQAVLSRFDVRFHWGKFTPHAVESVTGAYERWEDFSRLRAAWDPDGIFLNPYLAPFFQNSDRNARRVTSGA